ncbi:hypothetical protein Phum_PHUM131580 [Pediculus humanus corporis]|uniref:Uncharacterized protein n=1 Tax=Pediculus humanus subsp. corporis TaxID=121224 RepID=E0VEF0_PEDHC|nr:uncharacterized protein Phum_PHUM131580 [Pediculus humanus corporis]EEB11756.1 hypothetical protein Phum_PHUM131580 [Pediculus humanus corporis]
MICHFTNVLEHGNYLFDREGKYGNRFFCNQHFGYSGTMKQKLTKNQERAHRLSLAKQKMKSPEKQTSPPGVIVNKLLQTPPAADATDRGGTPERIEFENLAENASDVDEGPSEMDEDEWTDRNFGASAAEFSSDDVLDATDSEEDDDDDQEDLLEEEALMTADETRKAAERWSRRHSLKSGSLHDSDENGHDSCEADDSDDFDEYSEGRYLFDLALLNSTGSAG